MDTLKSKIAATYKKHKVPNYRMPTMYGTNTMRDKNGNPRNIPRFKTPCPRLDCLSSTHGHTLTHQDPTIPD